MGENNYVMENEPKKPKTHRSILLSPMVTIRQNHLSKKDVARIKRHLSARMSVISFIVAFATLFLAIGVFLYENISTGWTQTAVYGKGSLIGQLVMIVASVMTIILVLVARPHLHEPLGRAFARLATDTLLVAVSFLVCISVIACSPYSPVRRSRSSGRGAAAGAAVSLSPPRCLMVRGSLGASFS